MREKVAAHKAGLGIGYAPRYMVEEELASGELVELAIEPEREPEDSMLAWRAANRGRALSFLVDGLMSRAGAL
jgi:DNA-binding transcriptional LysR family regulator